MEPAIDYNTIFLKDNFTADQLEQKVVDDKTLKRLGTTAKEINDRINELFGPR